MRGRFPFSKIASSSALLSGAILFLGASSFWCACVRLNFLVFFVVNLNEWACLFTFSCASSSLPFLFIAFPIFPSSSSSSSSFFPRPPLHALWPILLLIIILSPFPVHGLSHQLFVHIIFFSVTILILRLIIIMTFILILSVFLTHILSSIYPRSWSWSSSSPSFPFSLLSIFSSTSSSSSSSSSSCHPHVFLIHLVVYLSVTCSSVFLPPTVFLLSVPSRGREGAGNGQGRGVWHHPSAPPLGTTRWSPVVRVFLSAHCLLRLFLCCRPFSVISAMCQLFDVYR